MVDINLSQTHSVFASLYPFQYLTLLLSLQKLRSNGKQYETNGWARYIFLGNASLAIISIAIWYFSYARYFINESGVYYWSMHIFNIATFFRFLLIHVFRLLNHSKEAQLFAAIDEFDGAMKALGKSKETLAANRKLVKYAIATIPMAGLNHILSEIFTNEIGYLEVSASMILSRLLFSVVGIVAKFQFYLWCIAITERFSMINDLLRNVRDRLRVQDVFVVSVYKNEQSLEKYTDLHRELTQLTRQMNDMYQFDMLCHFFIMFVVIFTNGYFSTYMMLISDVDSSFISFISNSLFVAGEIILSIKSSTDLCNASYQALDIFNNLKVDPDDCSTQRLVMSSIFELKANRLEITACRFFNVNYSTLAVMLTITTNYIFILLQFEEMTSDGKNVTGMTSNETILFDS